MATSIHVKLENQEALELKRNVLLLEKSLLEIVKNIREYNALRKKEFILKNKVKKDLSRLKSLILELDSSLPKEEAIKMLQKLHPEERRSEAVIKKQIVKAKKIQEQPRLRSDIESQIQEIQEKLARLG
jgi:hypothetical protein